MKNLLTLFIMILIGGPVFSQSWWPQTSSTTENLMNVDFNNDFNGIVFGDKLTTTVRTANQGFTWSPVSQVFTNGDMRSSAYLTSSMIIAVGIHDIVGGDGVIMKSINSGLSWTVDSTVAEKLFDVSFADASTGWVSGENGFIAKTPDAGSNWSPLTTGTGEDIFGIDFVSLNEGWGVGTVAGDAIILRTKDGGTSWTEQASAITEDLFAVDFIDPANGWAVGAAGKIIFTTDSGNVWTEQTSGTGEDLFDVNFISATEGWAVGAAGTVLKTVDGGSSWTAETSGTGQDIQSIHMRSSTLGWFCGDGGVIHVYGVAPPNDIQEFTQFISVYPNPAEDIIYFEFENNSEKEIILMDFSGKMVNSWTNIADLKYRIELDGLDSAPYFYLVKESENIIRTGKIIVK